VKKRERENKRKSERVKEREREGDIVASADHSWASHIIVRIEQWVAPPLPIFYTRLVIR